jgi:hypothetical protein
MVLRKWTTRASSQWLSDTTAMGVGPFPGQAFSGTDEITPNSNARACEDHSHLSVDGFRHRATELWQRFRRAD